MKTHRIAVIAGDGIGKEVMPEGLRALQAAAGRFGIALEFARFDWASCDYYLEHGTMMPDDWKQQLDGVDAIYFGAVGWPETVPDHISLWGSLLRFRREFDQYVNLRPVRLMPGVPCPLANKQPGDIDFYVVRENTEGEYSSVGGRMFEGTEREFVLQESVFTRTGVDRVLQYAFELAAEFQQRAPQRYVIRHQRRPAYGAEEDGVEALELLEPVVRHHLAVLGVVVAAGPLEGGPFDADLEAARGCLHHAYALGHDFLADAVAGDDCDALLAHGVLLKNWNASSRRSCGASSAM